MKTIWCDRSRSEADTTAEATADAVHSDPYCLACHASLDPVAASLFGFWWLSLYSEIEETTYHPEREALWEQFLGVEPAWYGTPISGLPDLGVSIARDSRFYTCAIETFAEPLWRRATTADDGDLLESLRVQFLRDDLSAKSLIAALTETEPYLDATPRMVTHDQFSASLQTLAELPLDLRRLRPARLRSAQGHEAPAGRSRWRSDSNASEDTGLHLGARGEAGGEAAASTVVKRELIDEGERIMLLEVTTADRPGDAAFTRAAVPPSSSIQRARRPSLAGRHGDAVDKCPSPRTPRPSPGRPSSR